jgi:GNAT superfamily N-acetyltransferase
MSIKNVSDQLHRWELVLDKLDKEGFPDIPPYPKQGALWWVVGDPAKDIVVGFAGLKCVGHDTAFLCRAYVKRAYKGLGIHRDLIRVREKAARKLGCKFLITYTHPLNLNSANNLISCGMKLYNPSNPFGMTGALYFRKDLTK